jgi:ankyrin repeat protein
MLVEAGAIINPDHDLTQSALEGAVQSDSPEIISYLIQSGADVNINRGAPLLQAVGSFNTDIAKLLLNAGADVNSLGIFRDRTPLSLVAGMSVTSPEDLHHLHGWLKPALRAVNGYLYGETPIPDYTSSKRRTATKKLLAEFKAKQLEFAEYLISCGASVNPCNEIYPLDIAIAARCDDMAALLKKHGAVGEHGGEQDAESGMVFLADIEELIANPPEDLFALTLQAKILPSDVLESESFDFDLELLADAKITLVTLDNIRKEFVSGGYPERGAAALIQPASKSGHDIGIDDQIVLLVTPGDPSNDIYYSVAHTISLNDCCAAILRLETD